MARQARRPTLEDVLELSGIEVLHPGGLEITKRIGEIVEMGGKDVLDVSCGRGTLPAYYAKTFRAQIVGIDLSPDMIRSSVDRAKREGVEHLTEFRVANSLALPFEDDSFDVVVNECAVGLTADPERCLAEMARVAKPAGHVVIHESTWLNKIPRDRAEEVASRLGTVPYALEEWKGMMEQAGLIDLWVEDWSGPENAAKIRPGRKLKDPNDVFSYWERLAIIFPKVVARYGVGGLLYANESAQKVTPLYRNQTIGYSLIRGRKPIGGRHGGLQA